MNSGAEQQRSNGTAGTPGDTHTPARVDSPTHPRLQATLLMVGIVVFLVVVSVLEVM